MRSYVKRFDEDVDGHHFDLQPVATDHDITDEGKVYWVSSGNENLRVTEDLASEVLELLGPDEHYSSSLWWERQPKHSSPW